MSDGQKGAGNGSQPRGHSPAVDQVLASLMQGAILLTPNVRSARRWAGLYDQAALSRGEQSWHAAHIVPWRAWTASLWQDAVISGLDNRILLSDLQERVLWRETIAASSSSTPEAADAQAWLCIDANRLLGAYDVDAGFSGGEYQHDTGSPDRLTFGRWYRAFEETCAQGNYLPASHLEIELAALIRQGRITPGGEFLLCGFHTMTPAQTALVAALESTGAAVQNLALLAEPQLPPTLLRCCNPRDEMQVCARWAREQLEQDPHRSIAIVVPSLEMEWAELERELRAAVAPEIADVTRPGRMAPYEFSTGRPIGHLPMAADALRVLHWCAHDVSLLDASAILRSRYLTLAGSPEAGADLDVHVLRALPVLRRRLSLDETAAALERYKAGDRLAALDKVSHRCRVARETFAWFAGEVRDLLDCCGWPGPAELSSDEFQAVDRWNEVLDRLSSLDLLGLKTTFEGFLAELDLAVRETTFAPENLGAPIQVIGLAEAASSTVDALWFLHAHGNTWPPRRSSHPLLPWRLQRDLRMPGTDPARDEAAVRDELAHLIESAGSACFSWSPEDDANGTERPSPLVEQAVLQYGGALRTAEPWVQAEQSTSYVISVPDLEPLPQLADERVSGGVSLLQAQAQCGFRAFAEKRLFAAPMEQQDAGLSPQDRGEQVHAILERFWNRVKDQRTLKDMGKHLDAVGVSARDSFLRECIAAEFHAPQGNAWESAYLGVQRQRLFHLLSDWLTFELERPPFEVLHTEKKIQDVPVGPLKLTMRVDRVDRVTSSEGGGTILIDYKTGAAAPAEWMGERLDQPQLPVYAVAGAAAAGMGKVDGIAFGGVRVGKTGMKLEGLAATAALLKAKPRKDFDFADQLEVWHHDLDRLATAFADGDASVDPKEYPATCDRCRQRMLCRVDAAALLQMEDLDEPEGDEATAWS